MVGVVVVIGGGIIIIIIFVVVVGKKENKKGNRERKKKTPKKNGKKTLSSLLSPLLSLLSLSPLPGRSRHPQINWRWRRRCCRVENSCTNGRIFGSCWGEYVV